ncbi:hypothetical protein F5Y14DRAFT_442034 [Nemania sp. NC0429]|nr:hypothetical protein F5Y14DRAFT_442034 [Nemania sp. NC0429]
MPHRVVDFFRSPTEGIHSIKQTVQRRAGPPARPGSQERQRPSRTSSYASSASSINGDGAVEGHSLTLPARLAESTKEKHRISFPGLHLVGHKTQKEPLQNPNAALNWRIESPPAIFYGSPGESTGALISGQLQLCVKEETLELESLEAKFELRVTQKKPFTGHCHDCASECTELKSWSFLSESTVLTQQRTHEFPFSILLEGHLPATTETPLVSVEYVFTAEARRRDGGLPLKLRRTINVQRSLPVPGIPHHSIRIFPPTDITASAHYDAIVHPNATSNLTLRLDGIGKRNANSGGIEYWKLKRLSWKLEETVATLAPACRKHAPKAAPGADVSESGNEARKGVQRSDTRVIAHADLHSGWKADYYSAEGTVDAEIEYHIGSASRPASCDLRGHHGAGAGDLISISHKLVVEMVVTQEYVALGHARHITPTGVARILRMNFGVIVTDRGGLGVSWDNEAPPIYQDVPPSPPSYASCAMIQHGSVEELSLPSPFPSPPLSPMLSPSP